MAVYAQEVDYRYLKKKDLETGNYLNRITTAKIEGYEGNQDKKVTEYWEKSRDNFIENIEDSLFIYSESIDLRVGDILRKIYRSNPEIDHSDFKFVVRTSPIPNASSYGNGIFAIHNGLFSITDSDDEIAFILCHEIAHYKLKHIDESIETFFRNTESKAAKDQISEIKARRYGQFSMAREFFQDLSFLMRKNSRQAEISADSLGNTYYSKTTYAPQAASEILEKLDFDEGAFFNHPTDLKKYFSFEEYPFKDYWTKKEETNLFSIEKPDNEYSLNEDSLRTHPAVKERANILREHIDQNKPKISTNSAELRSISALISTHVALDRKQFDLALYFLLQQYELGNINAEEFNIQIATLLRKIYELKGSHSIGKYISPENPFSKEEELDKLRRFIVNIEMKNTRKIGYWFCVYNKASLSTTTKGKDLINYFENINAN
ncbi:M48 family metallopeptidase [Gramella sp. MAR_2010_147]|uniref:M48 family metallopeptidase n=1 Tax=Gramella sp. MAR_2010_147 TaxID=1250205 RepID=UPI0012FE77DA|nr:M48 family metallopeptidase [Gramella sp. MAR_2010_147]